jgi:hypothetical protein
LRTNGNKNPRRRRERRRKRRKISAEKINSIGEFEENECWEKK